MHVSIPDEEEIPLRRARQILERNIRAERRQQAMADQNPAQQAPDAALAQAINGLVAFLQQQQQPPAAPVQQPAAPLLNLYDSDQPFDLSTRAGSSAFNQACEPLDAKYDGTVDTFPAFVTSLRLRAREVGWDRAGATNILIVNGVNILDGYHNLTQTQVDAASAARNNPRAIQNARALFQACKRSLEGDIFTLVFQQDGNIPGTEDGVSLFFTVTTYTMSSSVRLSMDSMDRLYAYDPTTRKFNISLINKDLLSLFVLARDIPNNKKLHYVLMVYSKIKQPESWATWVRMETQHIESGAIIDYQQFMNSAVMEQGKIIRMEHGFAGSTLTVSEDVVAMIAKHDSKRQQATKKKTKEEGDASDDAAKKRGNKPPFVKHTKKTGGRDAESYKVGDHKTWNEKEWYFCDCPNHREGAHFHTHKAEDCKTRKKWIDGGSKPAANLVDAEDESNADEQEEEENGTDAEPGARAALATAFQALHYDPQAQSLIADVISALHSDE